MRIEWNPAKASSAATGYILDELATFLPETQDELRSKAYVTRIDLAVDVPGISSRDLAAQRTSHPKKAEVFINADRVNPSRAGTRGLTAAASFAEQSPFAEILVAGHADRSGGEAYNARLAQLRAETVATALRGHGIPAERIRVTQYGETAPAVPTDDDVYEALNRRVEITFKPSDRAVARAGLQRMAD